MPENPLPNNKRSVLHPLWAFIGTGVYSGYCPIASGTAGSLVALLLYFIPGMENPLILGIAIVLSLAAGVPAASALARIHGDDPSIVVIDEITGMWISLLFLPKNIVLASLAFFLFRIYDIIKPPPARQMERIHGGWGIMLDDVVAGMYASISVHMIRLIVPALRP